MNHKIKKGSQNGVHMNARNETDHVTSRRRFVSRPPLAYMGGRSSTARGASLEDGGESGNAPRPTSNFTVDVETARDLGEPDENGPVDVPEAGSHVSSKSLQDQRGFSIVLDDVGNEMQCKTILQHVNAAIYPGELCAVLGPSGAGKTTLLDIVAGQFGKTFCFTGIQLNKNRRSKD